MYRKFIHIFPSDILSVTFFRLLLTIKRYYKNRWSFWPRGGRIPTPVICRVPPGFLDSNFDQVITRGRRGGGNVTKVLCGKIPLRGPIPGPFIYHFPLSLTVYWQMLPLSPKKFEPLLSAVNALSLKHELITKLESFMDFFTSIKRICRPFRAFLQTEMTDFPTLLSVASTSDSLPYHIPEA